MLWPAVLRTKMSTSTERVGRWVLALCALGLTATTVLLAADRARPAALGVAVYLAGAALALQPFVVAARSRHLPVEARAWGMAAGTGWLLAGLVLDVVALAGGEGEDALDRVFPVLAVGFVRAGARRVADVPAPRCARRGTARQPPARRAADGRWPQPRRPHERRAASAALPLPPSVRSAGWVVAIVGLASFLPLGLVALLARPDGTREPGSIPSSWWPWWRSSRWSSRSSSSSPGGRDAGSSRTAVDRRDDAGDPRPARRRAAAGVAHRHVVDESLLADTVAAGHLTAAVTERVCRHVVGLVADGAEAVLVTCSSIGAAAEVAAGRVAVPVRRIDTPMAHAAVGMADRVGVLATLGTTLEPTWPSCIGRRPRTAGR